MDSTGGKMGRREPEVGNLRPLALAVAFGFLVVILIGAAVAYFAIRLDQTQSDFNNSLVIQADARQVLSAIQGVETSQRGYLLTGQQRYLDNYEQLTGGYQMAVKRLADELKGRPEEMHRLAQIRDIAGRRIDELNQALEAYRSGNKEEAFRIVSAGNGEELMAQIRLIFTDFLAANQDEARQASDGLAIWTRWLLPLILLALAGLLGLALAVSAITRRQVATLTASRTELAALNDNLERHVEERTLDLETARATAEVERERAEREKARAEALLADVNHRVGNNLALVSSFLGLQLRSVTDPRSRQVLEAARARVHTIATTQRKLRLGSETEMTQIDGLLREVIEDVTAALADTRRISLEWDVEPIRVQSRDAVSVGVIASELVLNAIKYAFPGREAGKIRISFRRADEGADIEVVDDGVGKLPETPSEGGGLGTQVIYLLCSQFGGEPVYSPATDDARRPGLSVRVPMPKLKVDQGEHRPA